jgi:hypothetical protein
MLRPIAIIVAAIALSRPGIAVDEAERYAKVLQEEAKERGFDPLTAVAIVHFESGWHPEVVSSNREDYGLGQIRARYVGACRSDSSPRDNPSDECRALKKSLLDAETNLRTMAQLIDDNRKLCLEKTKSGATSRWLASYQGLNFPKQGKWCQPGEKTWQVVKYRDFLVRELGKKKPSASAKNGASKSAKPKPPKVERGGATKKPRR